MAAAGPMVTGSRLQPEVSRRPDSRVAAMARAESRLTALIITARLDSKKPGMAVAIPGFRFVCLLDLVDLGQVSKGLLDFLGRVLVVLETAGEVFVVGSEVEVSVAAVGDQDRLCLARLTTF